MKFSKLALGFVAALGMNAALAADGTVTFNGEVVDSTCTVTNANQTVTLPTVSTSALGASGAVAGITAFSLDLTGCNANDDVGIRFENGTNVNAAGRLKNNGTANNVNVQVLDGANNVLNLADPAASLVQTADGAGASTFDYFAQYYADGAAAEAGNVTTSVEFTVIYP